MEPPEKTKKPTKIPNAEELLDLMGASAYGAWTDVVDFIEENYDMEAGWDAGRKAGVYEHKFRRSGKTLCALYAREGCFGFMVVFGRAEREKFEASQENFSPEVRKIYGETHQYNDGKWLMIEVLDGEWLEDIKNLLLIKKRPRTGSKETPLIEL